MGVEVRLSNLTVIANMASSGEERDVKKMGGDKEPKGKKRQSLAPNPQNLHRLQVTGQATQTDSRFSPMKPRSPSPRTFSSCLDVTQPGSPRERLGRLRSPCKGGLSSTSPNRRSPFPSCSPSRPSYSPGRRSPLLATNNPDPEGSPDSPVDHCTVISSTNKMTRVLCDFS